MAEQNAAKTRTNGSSVVPEHLVLEHILPRLPVKPLIRFKSVSKLWHGTISSSKFAKLCLKFSPFNSNQFIVLTGSNVIGYKLMLVRYDEVNNVKAPVELNCGFPALSVNSRIVGSCHGLLCIFNIFTIVENGDLPGRNSIFSICNPATNQSRRDIALPDSLKFVIECWFGCTSSEEDYKIVASLYGCNPTKQYYVYSFRTESWKLISELDQFIIYQCLSNITAPVNDLLYWSPFLLKFPGFGGKPKRIVALDLVNDQVKEFPWIEWLSDYTEATFFVTSGRLSLYCCHFHYDQLPSDVWILKEHGDWSSWEKSYSFRLGECMLLNVTPTGKFFVFYYCLETDSEKLKLIDPGENAGESEDSVLEGGVLGAVEGYVETLISPFRIIKLSV